MLNIRKSGILMPISSLDSKYGIGALGKSAYKFVDFLEKTGQSYWQILPIGPTGYADSPYQTVSSFAGNPYFIDIETLISKNLITKSQADSFDFGDNKLSVDYYKLFCNRNNLLQLAVDKFDLTNEKFICFCKENEFWLDDYAIFMAIKESNNFVSFTLWDENIRLRDENVLLELEKTYSKKITFYKVIQFMFFEQWFELKKYANEKGVSIVGDIPIYVSPDSVELWANPELFQVDENKNVTHVAGCPPDSFSKTGQLWGNPLYNWEYHKQTNYEWWCSRLKYCCEIYDVTRIDHFRGFESFYSIIAGAKDASNGNWVKGMGKDFVQTIHTNLPDLSIIAEDLGFLTEEVQELVKFSKFPSMKILQFAFDSKDDSDHLPHNYNSNSVIYTGTHDNSTTQEWIQICGEQDLDFACRYLNVKNLDEFTDEMIRTCMASVCNTCIIPLQDYLLLGKEARMNTPGTKSNNWKWRLDGEQLNNHVAKKIKHLTTTYFRSNQSNEE